MQNRLFVVLAGTAVVVSGALIGCFVGNSAGGADTSGYLNSARLLRQGRVSEPLRTIPGIAPAAYPPYAFVPLGMRAGREPGTIVPSYPVGLPLHLTAASFLFGLDRAATVVNTLAWIGAIVLLYHLARLMGLARRWAVAAVVSFAVFPVTVLQSVRLMSDLLATTWCLAAIAFAIRSQKHAGYAVVSGVSFAVAVLVRPTDVLLAPAIGLAIGANPVALALAAAGAAPILAGLGLSNLALYGSVLTTGYSGIGPLVSPAYLGRGLLHFGRWLGTFLGPPALFLVVGGGGILAVRGDRRQGVLLCWSGAFVGFYAMYEQSFYGWWRLRFLLPALPGIIISALAVALAVSHFVKMRWGHRALVWRGVNAALLGCLIWNLGASVYWVTAHRIWEVGAGDDIFPSCVAWAEKQIPANAAFLAMEASGAIYYYGHHPVVRFDHLDEASYARFRAEASAANVPLYALLFRIDRLEFERRWPRAWQRVGSLGRHRCGRLEPHRQVPQRGNATGSSHAAPSHRGSIKGSKVRRVHSGQPGRGRHRQGPQTLSCAMI